VKLGYILFLAALLSPVASGLEVIDSDAKHSKLVTELVVKKILPILNKLEISDQAALAPVKIKVVTNLIASDIALSIDGELPRVLISNQFIEGLDAYAEAYTVAVHKSSPNFPEHYFHQYFWHTHPEYSGIALDSPMSFSELPPSQQEILLKRKEKLLESALMDIVLHELGHHAENAFYSYRTSYFVKKDMELLADEWALNVRDGFFAELDPIGRLLSIAYVFERDRWSMLSDDVNYPRMITWIADNADPVCEDAVEDHVRTFCEQLQNDLSIYFSGKAEQAYRDRIDQGDEYASFPLAQILLKKSRYHLACSYFKESHDSGNVKRAAVYVAWCYLNGFLKPSPPDAQILALTKSRAALMYGYTDTTRYIESLNQNYRIQ
jgi:hypothetical protein